MTVSVFCCLHHQMLFTLGREILITLNPQNTIGWASQHNPYEQLDLPGFKKPFFFFFSNVCSHSLPCLFSFWFCFKPCGTINTESVSFFLFFFLFISASRCCMQIAIWPVRSSGICLMARYTTSWGSKWIARMPFQKCMTKSAKLPGTEPERPN